MVTTYSLGQRCQRGCKLPQEDTLTSTSSSTYHHRVKLNINVKGVHITTTTINGKQENPPQISLKIIKIIYQS